MRMLIDDEEPPASSSSSTSDGGEFLQARRDFTNHMVGAFCTGAVYFEPLRVLKFSECEQLDDGFGHGFVSFGELMEGLEHVELDGIDHLSRLACDEIIKLIQLSVDQRKKSINNSEDNNNNKSKNVQGLYCLKSLVVGGVGANALIDYYQKFLNKLREFGRRGEIKLRIV